MNLLKTLMAASVLAAPSSLLAASSTSMLAVHVPFSFTAAGQNFEPGDYRVGQADRGIICIHGIGKGVLRVAVQNTATRPGAPSALQFTKDSSSVERLVGIQVEGADLRLMH